MPVEGASREELRAALLRVLGEASFRDAAQRFPREIAALPLLDQIGDSLARMPTGPY